MEWKMLILFLLVIVILLAICYLLKEKKKLRNAFFAVILLCCAGVLCYNTVFYYNSKSLSIQICNEAKETTKFELPNHVLTNEYFFVRFNSYLPLDHVKNRLGQSVDSMFWDSEYKQLAFSYKNNIYTLKNSKNSKFLWIPKHEYIIDCRCITLEENDTYYEVPFPRNVQVEDIDLYERERKIKGSYEEIKKYYQGFTNVQFDENQITLDYKNYQIKIVVDGDTVKFDLIK